jgi:hypothetical protein
MGMFDKLKKQAEKLADEHGDQIAKGLDKAGEVVDKRTKGKYAGTIDEATGKAKEAVDKLAGEDEK